jgi:phosphatidylglycerophosphate synthase
LTATELGKESEKLIYKGESLVRIVDIKEKCYPKNKKDIDRVVNLWIYFVIRPASFYATYFAVNARISANQATLIGFMAGIVSLYMAYIGNFFFAAVFLNMFAVLDCVDGNIARLGKPTKRGEYFDAVSGDVISCSFFPIFLTSALRDGHLANFEISVSTDIFSLIVIIGFTQILTALASQRFHLILGQNGQVNSQKSVSFLEILLRNGYGAAFLLPAALLVSIFGIFDILLIYLLISTPVFYFIILIRASLRGE